MDDANASNKLLIDLHHVCELLDISPATCRRWYAAGDMPMPVRVGRRSIRFRVAELEHWILAGCPRADGTIISPRRMTAGGNIE